MQERKGWLELRQSSVDVKSPHDADAKEDNFTRFQTPGA
jgi:hypothetical protein